MATSARFLINVLSPKKCLFTIKLIFYIGILLRQWYAPNGIIPNEDYWVFALRRRPTYHLTHPVLFCQILSVIQSRKLNIHAFMHLNIHIPYIHRYAQASFIHDCISQISMSPNVLSDRISLIQFLSLSLFHQRHPQSV